MLIALCSSCTSDPRVEDLSQQFDALKKEMAQLREELRILSAALEEQAGFRQNLEETRRQVAALEFSLRNAQQIQQTRGENFNTVKPFGVDINQSEIKAQIIEVVPD